MNGIVDTRLGANLGYTREVTKTAKAIIEAAKEKDKNANKAMFSQGTINKYTQQTKEKSEERESQEEEMEIG